MSINRPTDWYPLTGGDPCPGSPDGWNTVVNFWYERSQAVNDIRAALYPNTTIDAEGNRFRRLESAFSDGTIMATLIAYEFETAGKTASDWKKKLSDMQSRADAALARAKIAQATIDDATAQIAALEAEAAQDDTVDPIISFRIGGFTGSGGLRGDIADAYAKISEEQSVVDGIRAEYKQESESFALAYQLRTVDGIYADSARGSLGGNPFASTDTVIGRMNEYDALELARAFESARKSPDSMPDLLEMLSEMSPEQIKTYFITHPEYALFATNPIGGDNVKRAESMMEWWNGDLPTLDEEGAIVKSPNRDDAGGGRLSEEQRMAFLQYAPAFIGNSQGIQYTYRSAANLTVLGLFSSNIEHREKYAKDSPLSTEDLVLPDGVRKAAEAMIGQYENLNKDRYDPQILTFEVTTSLVDDFHWDDVKAAISIGNLDTADSISYLTHGIANNAQENLPHHVTAAKSLYDGENYTLARYENSDVSSHATVAWMNFEAPQHPDKYDLSVLNNDKAIAGGHRYAQDLDTLNTLRGAENIRLNTVAHSYGTGATFSGMTEMKTPVDSAFFIGSAGLPQDLVEKVKSGEVILAVDSRNIAYAKASEDGIAGLGYAKFWNKANPSELDGATELSAEGGYTTSGQYLQDTDGHGLYYEGSLEGYIKEGTALYHYVPLWTTDNREHIGLLLDYVNPDDLRPARLGPDVYGLEPANERTEMTSAEDIAKLKEYAADHSIPWEDVQESIPQ